MMLVAGWLTCAKGPVMVLKGVWGTAVGLMDTKERIWALHRLLLT